MVAKVPILPAWLGREDVSIGGTSARLWEDVNIGLRGILSVIWSMIHGSWPGVIVRKKEPGRTTEAFISLNRFCVRVGAKPRTSRPNTLMRPIFSGT